MGRLKPLSILLAAWLLALPALAAPAQTDIPPRTPKVAGQFYPDDPAELHQLIAGYLGQQAAPSPRKPRILIVPHAGYQYSGVIAAAGYRQLEGQTYDGVVVVGFSHQRPFEGVSVDTRAVYETPLGPLPVDRKAVDGLLAFPGMEFRESAHEDAEHSLEVQLPFLKTMLPETPIVPVMMGSARWQDAMRLAEALTALAKRGDYLFIFTTDLSHYHPYDQAAEIDARTIEAMLKETPQAVARLFQSGRLEACGQGPVMTGLLLADRLGYLTRELLTEANSGDTAGDASRVVGYAAVALYERPGPGAAQLPAPAGAALLTAARATLERTLRPGRKTAADPAKILRAVPELSRRRGLFVTLMKRGQLRGCIGQLQPQQPLMSLLPQVANDAALRDDRFAPVTAEELPELRIEVSVLTVPQRLERLEDLVPGRDGVILQSEGHSGVFLPQVWDQTGWTREEFLRELASQKAGLPPEAWRAATLYVFQDQLFEEGGSPH